MNSPISNSLKKEFNYHLLFLWFIILTGTTLRLFNFFGTPFMDDELSVIIRLRFDNFHDLIRYGVMVEGHPAGVQVFLWFWAKLFGMSELSMRLPFLLMGVGCIPLMYTVTKLWINKTGSLFTAAIIATSQYTIFYSTIIRPYIAGLFFILCLLIPWAKMTFHQDFRWRNIILFGLFASISAYIHQFSMLTAFLISITGLFFVNRKTALRYLAGCLIAIILYLPHLSILLHQISLKGIGSWLGAPTPAFISQYFLYLVHFSWITALGVIIAIVCCNRFHKRVWKSRRKKFVISFLLFLLPLLTGYLYSIFIDPVLQFSALIFSFPFLLLSLFSFVDEKLTLAKSIMLFILIAAMLYGLIAVRQYHTAMKKQWYEISYKKALAYQSEQGADNVVCALTMDSLFLDYYNQKYNKQLESIVYQYVEYTNSCFEEKIRTRKEEYLIVSGLSDEKLYIAQEYFPYLIDYEPLFTSEVYVFSKIKKEDCKENTPLLYYEEFLFDEDDRKKEFITIKEFQLDEITSSRFTKLMLTFDFEIDSLNPNYLIVLETFRNGERIDWRGSNISDYRIDKGSHSRTILPLRYEIMIRSSEMLPQYHSRISLWNMDKQTVVKPLKFTVSASHDNHYIYSDSENMK